MSAADKARFTRRSFLVGSGLALGAAACSSNNAKSPSASSSTGTRAPVTLRYGEAGTFPTFNPWAQESGESDVANQVFSRLVYQDAQGNLVGDLAESWVLAPDGLSITLKLRPGLTWQDGRKLEAADFVTMYGYLSNPAFKKNLGVEKMRGLFQPVKAVKAPNSSTVLMEFSTPVPYVNNIFDYFYAVRFDNPNDLSFLTHLPIGTGPFRMTRYVQGQRAEFKAFPGYHVKGQPGVNGFVFDIFANGSDLISDLRSGLVEGILVADYASLNALKNNPSYYTSAAQLGVWNLMVNCAKPPLDNVAVRQALSWSMDRNSFSTAAFFGVEKPVTSPFYTPAATGYVADLVHAQSFNLAKAKSLLDGANIHNLSFTFPSPTAAPNMQTVAEIWQSDLAKIGVKMKIRTISNALWNTLGAEKDLGGSDVMPWNNARCLLDGSVFWSTQGNYLPGVPTGYVNPAMTKLIASGVAEVNPAKRRRIYQQLNEIVVRDCYCLSLVTLSNIWAWSSAVKGVTSDLIGNLSLGSARASA